MPKQKAVTHCNSNTMQVTNAFDHAARAAADFMGQSMAENTRKGYARDWEQFVSWCTEAGRYGEGISALPSNDFTLAMYVGSCGSLRPNTLKRRLAAIRAVHRLKGHSEALLDTPLFDTAYRGYKRNSAKFKVEPQKAATLEVISTIAELIDTSTLIGLRNLAILTVTFDGALRRSEAVAIDVDDLSDDEDGLLIRLRGSKGDPLGALRPQVPILSNPGSRLCPVTAVRRWIEAGEIKEGALFRRMLPSAAGYVVTDERLSDQAVYRLIKDLTAKAGIKGRFGAHSVRRGLITSAIRGGSDIVSVQRHVRHKDINTTAAYVEDDVKFREHPARRWRGE